MQKLLICISILFATTAYAQERDSILSLEEYLGYVKHYHPVVKQAHLLTTEGEAKLLKSRGAFDPKLSVDYNRKKFKGTEYYDKLNTTFKIPTWYGVELSAKYENTEGTYLNPEYNTPEDGLYSAGVSVNLAQGLLTNKRMATLKQAKLYTKQAEAKRQLLVNEFLYEAIATYFNWLKNYQAKQVYADYVINAQNRLENVKTSYFAGEYPAVDTLEASINYKSRVLDYEKSKIGYLKSTLEVSNYLWLENNVPLEIRDSIVPDVETINVIDVVLNSSILNSTDELIENHPKLQELQTKEDILTVDRNLKKNNLLPIVNLEYNFLSSDYEQLDSFSTADYKSGLKVVFPLFLRKERGDLALSNMKLQDIAYDITVTKVTLKNKIEGTIQEIASYGIQYDLLQDLVFDYKNIVRSEERKFSLGEGSLFLVNYREAKLIETQLKQIDSEYQLFTKKSDLLRVLNTL
ncbi:TolC family protein [Formosa algae]|uniref:Outer membrane protein TolC n=1 Tax=Formosa algae TaxID=225843 RepID=A0A9X0YN40_9FLAO|nr:TolC family protein [Formosa algae]MBP1840973.1 outer membrane protein TolC [Formosa algae]MDQ0336130.1 outer membrane protein TolC [Formosa algae]